MKELGFSKMAFLILFLWVLLIHFMSYTPFGISLSWVSFLFGLLIFVISPYYGLVFYFLTLLFNDDINKYDLDIPPLDSILTVSAGGFSISLIWSVLIFLFLLIAKLSSGKTKFIVAQPVIIFFLFLFLGSLRIYNFKNPAFITDVGFIINVILGYLLGERLLSSPEKIRFYFGLILAVFISKFLLISFQGVLSSMSGVFYTLKAESASNFILLPIIFSLLILFRHGMVISIGVKNMFLFVLFLSITYLFITISRERILLVAMALVVYLLVFKKIRVAVFAVLLLIAGFFVISVTNPNMFSFVVWKLTTMLPNAESNANASSSVRWIELQNIVYEQIKSPYKLFIGTGWGGSFTSEYVPFSSRILGTSSFPDEWIDEDKYYKPHGTYLYILLKYGLVGVSLFYGSLIIFSANAIAKVKKRIRSIVNTSDANNFEYANWYILVTVAISLPIVALIIFTSKLQILTGFLVFMCYAINRPINSLLK